MLQSQDQGQHNRDAILEPEEGRRLAGLFGEGNAGGKKVAVVIVADKTITSSISIES